MNIAIDISPLQGPHKMRGIGATVINFINGLSSHDRAENSFVFIAFQGLAVDDLISKLLDLDGLRYEIVYMKKEANLPSTEARPRKLMRAIKAPRNILSLWEYYRGNNSLPSNLDVDIYIQFDQQQSLPRISGAKKILIVYDIIPYVLEWDYLYSYQTARSHEHSRKGSIYIALQRWTYITKLRLTIKRSDRVIAISNKTKDDIVKYAHIEPGKIEVVPLGINKQNIGSTPAKVQLCDFIQSSWGYVKRPLKMNISKTKFILFVGGADKRRKLSDLVTAFNILRAQGYDLKLVLVGDIMQGPENIPVTETRRALESSSYSSDIIYMGFVTDEVRQLLYANALTFIYPSTYEGFGLPILEAMSFGCPVVCYDNQAVREVAHDLPLYATDALSIAGHIKEVLSDRAKYTSKEYKNRLVKQSCRRTWNDVSKDMITLAQSVFSQN